MATSQRFDLAIEKLYKAFHQGTLNPECSNHCAVGNICDNKDAWKNLTDKHGSTKLNYVGLVNENLGRRINGYKPSELLQIEATFLKACGYSLPYSSKSQGKPKHFSNDILFDGLCAVVQILCVLEGIPNIMDFRKLFDFKPSTHAQVEVRRFYNLDAKGEL